MVQIQPPSGAKKLTKLTLISLGISAIVWLIWGFIGLRGTPCGWSERIKGSECVRIIPRHGSVGAEQVYFSSDGSNILFLDGTTVRIEPVRKKTPFDSGKSIPLFSLEQFDKEQGELRDMEGFSLSPNEKIVLICARYSAKSKYRTRLLLKELDRPGSARTISEDLFCDYSNPNFISSSVIALNSYEGDVNHVLFIDLEGNLLQELPGAQFWGNMHISHLLPLPVEDVTSLYSVPQFEKLAEFHFPSNLWKAAISTQGDYVFANDDRDAVIYMLDPSSGEVVYTFSDKAYSDSRTFTISQDGRFLAAGFSDYDGRFVDSHAALYVWDLSDKRIIKKIVTDDYSSVPQSLDFSSDGKLLAIGTWRYVIILDLTK